MTTVGVSDTRPEAMAHLASLQPWLSSSRAQAIAECQDSSWLERAYGERGQTPGAPLVLAHPLFPDARLAEVKRGLLSQAHVTLPSRTPLLCAVASRPDNTDADWDMLLRSRSLTVRAFCAGNPKAPDLVLRRLGRSKSLEVLTHWVTNPAVSLSAVTTRLANDGGRKCRAAATLLCRALSRPGLDADECTSLLDSVARAHFEEEPLCPEYTIALYATATTYSRFPTTRGYPNHAVHGWVTPPLLSPERSQALAEWLVTVAMDSFGSYTKDEFRRLLDPEMPLREELLAEVFSWLEARAQDSPPLPRFDYVSLQFALVQHPQCPTERLVEACFSEDNRIAYAASNNPNTPEHARVYAALRFPVRK